MNDTNLSALGMVYDHVYKQPYSGSFKLTVRGLGVGAISSTNASHQCSRLGSFPLYFKDTLCYCEGERWNALFEENQILEEALEV